MKKIVLLLLMVSWFAPDMLGENIDLTEEEKEVLKVRIIDKLEDFQYFLQTMADRRNSLDVRQSARTSNINLFIGKCEPYETFDFWSEEPMKMPAVRMQTSSLKRPNYKPKQLMKNYFAKIMGGMGYSNIRIEQSDAITIDNFRKISDGKYLAIAHIVQRFIGYNENGAVRYGDTTEKKVKIHVDMVEIPTEDGYERLWDVKLGDMYVVSTERL
jgi:hypothetical protein